MLFEKTVEKLKNISLANEVFVTAVDFDDMKPKRKDAARRAYANTYDLQLEIMQVVTLIETSHILAENELIVPHIVDEYCRLKRLSTELTKELKAMNQYSEYKQLIESINNANKVSELSSMLFDDLTHIANNKSVDIDFKQEMEKFKKS